MTRIPKLTTANTGRRTFRAARGEAKLAVMSVLSEQDRYLSRVQISRIINEKSNGEWAITPSAVGIQLEGLKDHGFIKEDWNPDVYANSDYQYVITDTGRRDATSRVKEFNALWAIFAEAPSDGSELENQLEKLQDALSVIGGLSEVGEEKVVQAVATLRREIYAALSE